jgi:hypothetical protein
VSICKEDFLDGLNFRAKNHAAEICKQTTLLGQLVPQHDVHGLRGRGGQ